MAFLKKWKKILLASIAIGAGTILWYSLSTGYFASFPVTYNQYNYPVIDVKIGDYNHALEVRIGSIFPLFLSRTTLDQTDKHSNGFTQWHDVNGEHYEAPAYLIPKMKIGNMTLTNVSATQTLESEALGKYLGSDLNLFLDFPHSRIIACNSFSKLKAKGLANDQWIQVPFETGRAGIIFQVTTDLGIRNLSLNTTSTTSAVRTSLMPSSEGFTSSTFSIGKREFGRTFFHSLEFPEALHETDGFIGMDFLKKYALYLDYSNKIAYIEPPHTYFECLPVTFSNYGIPIININIKGNIYPLEIDLGSSFLFCLSQEVLQKVQKHPYGKAKWSDFKGNRYKSPAYTISEIKLGNLVLVDSIVTEEREDFHTNTNMNGFPSQQIGSIGRPILEKYNLFLDFQNSLIYASNSYFDLQQAGLVSQHPFVIPFDLHPDGILLFIKTDMGNYHLLLDTAATHTAIRSPHPSSTLKFELMGHDFGARSIISLDLNPNLDYDGYLGMDFLGKYPIFIDYTNKLIYLDLQMRILKK